MVASCREIVSIAALLLLVTLAAPTRSAAQSEPEAPAYVYPAGWLQSTNAANGVISLAPRNVPAGSACVLTVFPAKLSNETAEAFHADVVRQAASYGRVLEPPIHESIGAFLVTTLHQFTAPGMQVWVRIYTVRWNNRGQVVMLSLNRLELLRSQLPIVDAMIQTARLPQLARGPAATPQGDVSTGGAGAMIAGLYSATTMRYDPLSGSSVIDQYWYLFSPDGQVCRGYTLPKLPPSANGDFRRFNFAATANADPENCGTFAVHGEEVTMRIGQRYAESIAFRAPGRNGKITIQRANYSLWLRW